VGGHQRVEAVQVPLGGPLEGLREKPLLGGKVVENEGLADSGGLGDIRGAGIREPPLGDNVAGGSQ